MTCLSCAKVVGCRTIWRWERGSPLTLEAVGEHFKHRRFRRVWEEKGAVLAQLSRGTKKGEYTMNMSRAT